MIPGSTIGSKRFGCRFASGTYFRIETLQDIRNLHQDRWSHFEVSPKAVLGVEFSTTDSARSTVLTIMKSRWKLLEVEWPHTTQEEVATALQMVMDRLSESYSSDASASEDRASPLKIASDDLSTVATMPGRPSITIPRKDKEPKESLDNQGPILVGRVISTGRSKTAKVEIVSKRRYPKYKKFLNTRTGVHVHDEFNDCRLGDVIMFQECRPISKTKHHRVLQVCGRQS
ncbi:MAG: 30S ribosomal protein S17 [Planctomycetota bacterium]